MLSDDDRGRESEFNSFYNASRPVYVKMTPYGTSVCSLCFSKTNGVTFCWPLQQNGSSVSRRRNCFRKKFQRTSETIRTGFPMFSGEWIKDQGIKIQFFPKKTVSFLGHIVSESGFEVDPEKVRAVGRVKEPSSLKDVRAFQGLVGCYQKFIPSFGKTVEPAYSFLIKPNKFEWNTECKNAVTELKKKPFRISSCRRPSFRISKR